MRGYKIVCIIGVVFFSLIWFVLNRFIICSIDRVFGYVKDCKKLDILSWFLNNLRLKYWLN